MFLQQKPLEVLSGWDAAVMGGYGGLSVPRAVVSPSCCAVTASCCALRVRLKWPWSSGGLVIVCQWSPRPPTNHRGSSRTHTAARSEAQGEWDVTDLARCHIWHSNPSIVLHIDSRVCAIPNCDWRLQRSQLLSTLHWAVLPESSLPTVPELINGFFQQKNFTVVSVQESLSLKREVSFQL